jgi:hypothetical protein
MMIASKLKRFVTYLDLKICDFWSKESWCLGISLITGPQKILCKFHVLLRHSIVNTEGQGSRQIAR